MPKIAELILFGPVRLMVDLAPASDLFTLTLDGPEEGKLLLSGTGLEVREQLVRLAEKCLIAERQIRAREKPHASARGM